jgi:hypothetical protein
MSSTSKLSPMASYCVRRLIQARKEAIVKTGSDPSQLASTLLLEPEEILKSLALSDTAYSQRINNLEVLARAHQNLTTEGQHPEELKILELQILGLLNLSIVSNSKDAHTSLSPSTSSPKIKMSEALEILQALIQCGSTYLGPKISNDYFTNSRPDVAWLECFILKGNNKLVMNGVASDNLYGQELEDIQHWVKTYIKKCSLIINGFYMMVDPKYLQRLFIPLNDVKPDE